MNRGQILHFFGGIKNAYTDYLITDISILCLKGMCEGFLVQNTSSFDLLSLDIYDYPSSPLLLLSGSLL